MRLDESDAAILVEKISNRTATIEDFDVASALMREAVHSTGAVTLLDAHILVKHSTARARLWEIQAQRGHQQTARAMTDDDGCIYDFDADGEPVRFKTWRDLVRIENDPMWGVA